MPAGTLLIRQRAIQLFRQNITQTEIATLLGVSRVTVSQWAKVYRQGGADALLRRVHTGRSRRLTNDQQREIASWLATSPREQGLEARRWTGREVAKLILRRFGVVHSATYCRKICRAVGVPIAAAFKPTRSMSPSARGRAGRPAKIAGPAAEQLRADLEPVDRGRIPQDWTRQELVDFIAERTGIAYAPRSVGGLLARLGLSLSIIPARQRRIETRPKPPIRETGHHPGRRLTANQIAELHGLLKRQSANAGWSAEGVRSLIWARFRVSYAPSSIPPLLQEFGISIHRARSGVSSASGKSVPDGTGSRRRR